LCDAPYRRNVAESEPNRHLEVVMARTLNEPHLRGHRPMPIADLDHMLATAAVVLGAVGLTLVAVGQYGLGTWCGIVGIVVGLSAQMFSRTRAERFVDMAALLACFLAFAIGAGQGGIY
jgi:hypothetical protein